VGGVDNDNSTLSNMTKLEHTRGKLKLLYFLRLAILSNYYYCLLLLVLAVVVVVCSVGYHIDHRKELKNLPWD